MDQPAVSSTCPCSLADSSVATLLDEGSGPSTDVLCSSECDKVEKMVANVGNTPDNPQGTMVAEVVYPGKGSPDSDSAEIHDDAGHEAIRVGIPVEPSAESVARYKNVASNFLANSSEPPGKLLILMSS